MYSEGERETRVKNNFELLVSVTNGDVIYQAQRRKSKYQQPEKNRMPFSYYFLTVLLNYKLHKNTHFTFFAYIISHCPY